MPEAPFSARDDVRPHSVVLTKGRSGLSGPAPGSCAARAPLPRPRAGAPRLITMPASEPVSAAYRENYGEKWLFQPAAHSPAGPGGPSQPRAQGESSTGSVSRGRGLHAGRPQHAACHPTQRPPDSSARPPGVAFEPAASLPRLRVTPARPSQPRGACRRHVAGNVPGSSGRAASWSASPLGVEGLPGVASGPVCRAEARWARRVELMVHRTQRGRGHS